MIGLDTNVIVRYLAQDEPRQAAAATRLIEGSLTAPQLTIEQAEVIWRAQRAFRDSKADFSDAVIVELGRDAGCSKTVTFDRQAATHPGFEALC